MKNSKSSVELSPTSKQLIILRHGETVEGSKGILLGHQPGHLTHKGKSDMERAGKLIVKEYGNIDVIYCSDLSRSIDSAKIIASVMDLVDIKVSLLARERSAGYNEGKNELEIDWNLHNKLPIGKRHHPGGESFESVRNRAINLISDLQNENKNVVLVGHLIFNYMLLSVLTGMTIKAALEVKLDSKIMKYDFQKYVLSIRNMRI